MLIIKKKINESIKLINQKKKPFFFFLIFERQLSVRETPKEMVIPQSIAQVGIKKKQSRAKVMIWR